MRGTLAGALVAASGPKHADRHRSAARLFLAVYCMVLVKEGLDLWTYADSTAGTV